MDPRYLDYSRVVSVLAQQEVLANDVAQTFCRSALPLLIAEMEVLQRLVDTKFSGVFPEPPVVEAEPVPQPASKPRKPRKSRKTRNAKRRP